MPFMSQETELVHQAHGLLQTWATALWGQPIILVNDSQTDQDANRKPHQRVHHEPLPGGGDPNYGSSGLPCKATKIAITCTGTPGRTCTEAMGI